MSEKPQKDRVSGELPPQELKLVEEQIIKTAQSFPEKIRVLEDKQRLPSKGELLKIRRSVMEDYFDLTREWVIKIICQKRQSLQEACCYQINCEVPINMK